MNFIMRVLIFDEFTTKIRILVDYNYVYIYLAHGISISCVLN